MTRPADKVSATKRAILKAGWTTPVIIAIGLPVSGFAQNLSGRANRTDEEDGLQGREELADGQTSSGGESGDSESLARRAGDGANQSTSEAAPGASGMNRTGEGSSQIGGGGGTTNPVGTIQGDGTTSGNSVTGSNAETAETTSWTRETSSLTRESSSDDGGRWSWRVRQYQLEEDDHLSRLDRWFRKWQRKLAKLEAKGNDQ